MLNIDHDSVRKRLKQLRLNNNATQQEIADLLHCSRSCYTYVETGKIEPSLSLLLKLCDIYNIPLQVLIDENAEYLALPKKKPKRSVAIYDLESDERRMLMLYRMCSSDGRMKIYQFAAKYVREENKNPRHG